MESIKVSVVMPVYNAGKYIEEALRDLTEQTYENFEVICVNDGSTDESKSIIERFVKQDKRVKIVSQSNKGGGSARNQGYDLSCGKYILFLDADDRYEKDLIEKAVNAAERNQSDVLIFAADEFHCETGVKKPAPWLLQNSSGRYDGNPFNYTTSTVWNKIYRRDYLEKNHIRHMDKRVIADTMYFSFFALMLTDRISFLDEVLIHYRSNNPESATARHDSRPTDIITVLSEIWGRIESEDILSDKIGIYVNFACKMLFERMSWFRSYESLSQMYEVLHIGGFSDIGLTEDNEKYIEDDNWKRLKRCITDNELPAYLFQREKYYKQIGLLTKTVYLLPDSIHAKLAESKCKVALYGAGMVGKSYFPQIQKIETVTVVAWVDAGYEKIGFPLQAPEVLCDISFDYIVICIEHRRYLNEIEEKLSRLGVPKGKILWETPGKQP